MTFECVSVTKLPLLSLSWVSAYQKRTAGVCDSVADLRVPAIDERANQLIVIAGIANQDISQHRALQLT